MNARTFLVRGLLAGLVAGLFSFVVAYTVGEPPVDAAIALEEAGGADPAESEPADHPHAEDDPAAHTHSHSHSHDEEEGGFSRDTQKTWGLATANLAVGVALGGIMGLVSAGVAGRLGRLSLVGSTALVMALGFTAYSLVPFLKYPAAPPAVGSGDTIGERTTYYFVFVVISIVAIVAAAVMSRRLASQRGAWSGVVAGGLGYVVVMATTAALMPAVNELGDFPADILWQFRISSLLTLATLWGVLGIALTGLLARAQQQAAPAAAAPATSTGQATQAGEPATV